MAYRDDDDFLEDEWLPAGEDDDPGDWDDERSEEDDDLIDCPECSKPIHAESEQCPHCGNYILDEPRSGELWRGRSWWWIALGVLGIIAVVVAFSRPW